MHLPLDPNVPVSHLTACFNKTTATYKYYWFLSILQAVEKGETTINKQTLFAGMIANAWYTVQYFKLSFGKQDMLQDAVRAIQSIENLSVNAKFELIHSRLSKTTRLQTIQQLRHFNQQVPFRFLNPWLPGITDSETKTYQASQKFTNDCLYALYPVEIIINPLWLNYLQVNSGILKDFCYWNLALFLQARNPSVPDIPNKLIKPPLRSSLKKQQTGYWDIVLRELQTVPCIYTDEPLSVGKYDVEHFIPYNFVSHNLIWNLIPASRSFNSRKSDKLPPYTRFFEKFFQLQMQGITIVSRINPDSDFLEEYLTIMPDFTPSMALDETKWRERFRETVQPLLTIAYNNGFEYLP